MGADAEISGRLMGCVKSSRTAGTPSDFAHRKSICATYHVQSAPRWRMWIVRQLLLRCEQVRLPVLFHFSFIKDGSFSSGCDTPSSLSKQLPILLHVFWNNKFALQCNLATRKSNPANKYASKQFRSYPLLRRKKTSISRSSSL